MKIHEEQTVGCCHLLVLWRRCRQIGGKGAQRTRRDASRQIEKPIVIAFAVLYFVIDALFFALIKPIVTWLSKLRIFARVGTWVRTLGPYSTLALFVICKRRSNNPSLKRPDLPVAPE